MVGQILPRRVMVNYVPILIADFVFERDACSFDLEFWSKLPRLQISRHEPSFIYYGYFFPPSFPFHINLSLHLKLPLV